ncbi:MAG TPA: Bpu10I family restriction endonuclease [Verrucomicrobiae bacterium]|jgi:hypothetical protein
MNKSNQLPTPHLDKLKACLQNKAMPEGDLERLHAAEKKYNEWIKAMNDVQRGSPNCVQRLVDATNIYKRYVELDLIFDSPGNFLYRQKGQLKLDNTILEEFLPHLVFQSLKGLEDGYQLGPASTFAGITMLSTLGKHGYGGLPKILSKDQDFVLGRQLHLRTSFDPLFRTFDVQDTALGYVCAECKTNLDKTMFQEAVATSRDLKQAVPGSLYFLIAEFLDMTPRSITTTQIDDVLIVRKAKRISSNIRQDFKTPESRKENREEHAKFIDASKYSATVFQRMIDKIQALINTTDPTEKVVLERGFF